MGNKINSRLDNASNITKDLLVETIKSNDPVRFDQMLIESEERKTYYFVKYVGTSFSREPKVIHFPLFQEFKTDFERTIESNGEITILKNTQLLDRIISKGYSPELNSKYSNENLAFGNLVLEMKNRKVDLTQPIYYIPNDTERHTCGNCNGDKYNPCPEHECHGQHIYDCNVCNTQGKVDCDDCRARGEYQCPSCHGKGRLRCAACGGSGSDKNSDYKFSKCKSCNGSGERKCSSLSGHGIIGAAVKKAAGNEYCGGTGIIRCSTCKASGKITCKKCAGNGRIECKTCHGDHQDNRYGKVDCPTCETAGELASISYIETTVYDLNKEIICTDGKEIGVAGFGVDSIKKFVDSNGQTEITYENLNGSNSSNYNSHSQFASEKSMIQLGISKSSYPQLVHEEIYTEGVPCATYNYNHILSATFHDVSVLSIDKEKEVLFHSNPTDVAQEKESVNDKIKEWLRQAFSTKSFKDKIDRKHEMFLMVHMAKADGVIEDAEKRFLSKTITGLHGFTTKEKNELFSLMSSSSLPPISPLNAYFSSKQRAEEAKKKIIELVAKVDGEYEKVEKEKIDEINKAIEDGFKAKPNVFARFFKTWQISIPLIISIISIIIFTYWFLIIMPVGIATEKHGELLKETSEIELFLSGNDSLSTSNIMTNYEAKTKILNLDHESELMFIINEKEISYKDYWSEKKKDLLVIVEDLISKEEPQNLEENSVVSEEVLPKLIPSEIEYEITPVISKVYFYSKPARKNKLDSFFLQGQTALLLGTAGDFSKISFNYKGKTTIGFVLSNEISENGLGGEVDTPDGEYYENFNSEEEELSPEYQ